MTIPNKIALYCRCTGTIVGISDYDPMRWPNSKWCNLQVEWDEHGYGERPERVNLWDIETPENSLVFSSPLNSKRQCLPSYGGTSLLYHYPGFHSLGPRSTEIILLFHSQFLGYRLITCHQFQGHKQILLGTCNTCQGSAQSWL